MRAKVLDIRGNWVYLEIPDQLRFGARYSLSEKLKRIRRDSVVDFDFTSRNETVSIMIWNTLDLVRKM